MQKVQKMKRFAVILALAFCSLSLTAKTGLVVIAHGSPSKEWNRNVLAIEKKLQKADIPGISYVRVALMEFAQPNIASVIRDCEKEGIDTVFALPLFISPSGHSEDDVPNILGLKYDPRVHSELVEENTEFVHTSIRIVEGPTLINSGVIEKAMVERIKALSKNPASEAIVLLAHGDPGRSGFWKHILNKCEASLRDAGFNYVDCTLVGMGQNLAEDIKPLLEKAQSSKERVLVQGIYLQSSVHSMARMAGMTGKSAGSIVYGTEGILPKSSDEVCEWIVKTTSEWLAER